MIVLGVDPGSPGKSGGTGLVLVDRRRLLDFAVVQDRDVDLGRRATVVSWEMQELLADRLDRIAAASHPGEVDLVAVEDIASPGGHARGRGGHIINPRYLLAAAVQAGVAIEWARHNGYPVVLVPPAGNGDAPALAYPDELTTTKTGKIRHARSAYDVALAGSKLHRWSR